jgi:hypothetical protein
MTSGSELLEVGEGTARRRPTVPRPVGLLLSGALVAAVVTAGLIELVPWLQGPPDTGLRVLVQGEEGLAWVDVDSGRRQDLPLGGSADDGVVTMVGTGVVVQRPQRPPVADTVVGYASSGSIHQVGEADRVLAASASSVWLVVDGSRGVEGGVALASAYGEWRSRVFPVPPGLQAVGTADDSLLALTGRYRSRQLVLWDPHAAERTASLGWVLGVRQVAGDYALVTTGCLTSGCTTATVSLSDGTTTEVRPPPGWSEAGEPGLVGEEGQVAMVVTDETGRSALALGAPDELRLVDVVLPASANRILDAGDGWLVLPAADEDVVLWRAGLSVDRQPRVELAAGERVLGATSAT